MSPAGCTPLGFGAGCGADGPASHTYRVLDRAQYHAGTDHHPGTHHVLDRLAGVVGLAEG
ncbi:hypothetical protein [Streptomyces sp. NPDC058092]|uniref:hypothetical protein n=1 Tax=Streptomyces sp. NPDC058092 TaxID=3346336 RepID=UPI0036EACBE1